MSQGFRPRKAYLGFALVALAIQAITPDPHDVTSFSISRILQSLLVDSLPLTDPDAPLGEDTQDEKADEVCAPASARTHIALRRPTNASPRLTSHAKRHRESSEHAACLHVSSAFGRNARTGMLILVLCRITC